MVKKRTFRLLFSVLGGPFIFFKKRGQILLKEDVWEPYTRYLKMQFYCNVEQSKDMHCSNAFW